MRVPAWLGRWRWEDRHVLTFYVLVFVVLQVQPAATLAWGAPPIAGAMPGISITDSKGISSDRYAVLSFDDGGGLIPGAKGAIGFVLNLMWSFYVQSMVTLGWALDVVTRMEWVTYLVGPLEAASVHLRSVLFSPVGATTLTGSLIGVLLLVAGAIAGVQILRGQSRGWWTILQSAAAAALAVGLFAAPVSLFAGSSSGLADPLIKARDFGRQLSTAAVSGAAPKADAGAISHGTILVDAFIRPIHQQINYGDSLDTADPDCAAVYDEALKSAASHKDLQEVRNKIKTASVCEKRFGERTDNPSTDWAVTLGVFWLGNSMLNLLIAAFVVLLCLAVIMLAWASLQLMFHIVVAIVPGSSRGPVLRDLVDIGISLVYIVTSQLVLGVIMACIQAIFATTNPAVPLPVRYLIMLVAELAGVVILIMVWIKHRAAGKAALARVEKGEPKPSIGQKAWAWGSAPASGRSALGTTAGMRSGGAGGVLGSNIPVLSPIVNSNAGRLAVMGAQAGATIATGGGKVAATMAMKALKHGGKTMAAGAGSAIRGGTAAVSNARNASAGHAPRWQASPVSQVASVAAGRAHRRMVNTVDVIRAGWRDTPAGVGRAAAPTTGNAKTDARLMAFGANLSGRHRSATQYQTQARINVAHQQQRQERSGQTPITTRGFAAQMARTAVANRAEAITNSVDHVKQAARDAREEAKQKAAAARYRILTDNGRRPMPGLAPYRQPRRPQPEQHS